MEELDAPEANTRTPSDDTLLTWSNFIGLLKKRYNKAPPAEDESPFEPTVILFIMTLLIVPPMTFKTKQALLLQQRIPTHILVTLSKMASEIWKVSMESGNVCRNEDPSTLILTTPLA